MVGVGCDYGFYAVGIYGFFMGVPIFNAGLALPAGIIVGHRLARSDPPSAARLTRRTCWFTTGVMTLACIASAALSLTDAYTAANLQGMLRLGFEVTPAMILALIIVGGAGLLIAEWWMTALTIRLTAAHLA